MGFLGTWTLGFLIIHHPGVARISMQVNEYPSAEVCQYEGEKFVRDNGYKFESVKFKCCDDPVMCYPRPGQP